MKSPFKAGFHEQAFHRGLVGFAGMTVACAVLASVTVLFDSASQMPWLTDTPANVAAMQRCDKVLGTAARGACAEEVVARVLARDTDIRLAQASPPAAGRPAGK